MCLDKPPKPFEPEEIDYVAILILGVLVFVVIFHAVCFMTMK